MMGVILHCISVLCSYHSESAEVVKDKKDARGRRMKISLQDQLLLKLIRLCPTFKEDLAFHFGISVSSSRLVTTWICYLHNYYTDKQVILPNLPTPFREKFPYCNLHCGCFVVIHRNSNCLCSCWKRPLVMTERGLFDWQPDREIGLGLNIPLFLERKSQI